MKQFYVYKVTNMFNQNYWIGAHYGELNDGYLGSGNCLDRPYPTVKREVDRYSRKSFRKEILMVLPEGSDKDKALAHLAHFELLDWKAAGCPGVFDEAE